MPLSIQDFLRLLESRPASLEAQSSIIENRIPLILGDGRAEVRRVGWALEAGEKELAAVEERGLDLLLLWTSLWSTPPDTLRSDRAGPGLAVERLTRARCAVAVAGPALENSASGPNHLLASELGVGSLSPLRNRISVPSDRLKLVVFTPAGYEERVTDALAQGGAGVIGHYSHCTFRTPGTGTYRPLDGAQPWAGTVGHLEHVEEIRLETVVPRENASEVLDRVRSVHPYEEMAYDLYPLEELREAPRPFGWVGEVSASLDSETLRTAGERCFGTVPALQINGMPGENQGQGLDPSPLSTRLVICLNNSPLGKLETRSLIQAGCGWVVCGDLTEDVRNILCGNGARIVQFSRESVQETIFATLLTCPDFLETCATGGISIERV
jgi:hypothetical protein